MIKEYLNLIKISKKGNFTDDKTYVIDLEGSQEYGEIYSILENTDDLNIMYENQVVTEEGSSLIYESDSQPLLFNLIADFDGDRYQLIINNISD